MAQVKLYRAVYYYAEGDDARMNFSRWVQAAWIDEVITELSTWNSDRDTIVEPTILGWEEKELDTEPI